MAKYSVGDYVFLANNGPRSRIEAVAEDNTDETKVIYFVISDRGACGCVTGDGLRRDMTGLPSDKAAKQKTAALQTQLDALVRGLARGLPPDRVAAINQKSDEINERIKEIEKLWRPKYYSAGLQPFNNLEPVQTIAYEPTFLKRMMTGYYYCLRNGARVEVDSRKEGMEFVILFSAQASIMVGTVGHSPIAKGQQTIFAGHVMFDGNGRLIEWNNNTGHYKTVVQYAHQASYVLDETGTPLLPKEKFKNLY